MQDCLMNVNEVAELLGMAPGTVYHLVCQRRIPFVRLSLRCLRFRRADIDAWIATKWIGEEKGYRQVRPGRLVREPE